jgi:hypothetical protein
MSRNRLAILLLFVGSLLLNVFSSKIAPAAYESAEYKVIESEGGFEVREYPELMLVATTTKIDAQGRDGSFMKLFRYISGANEAKQKISMTTPVFMENDKEGSEVQMGFVMPKEVASNSVPAPSSPDIKVLKRSGGRFAVIRFAGRLDAKLAKESEEKLRTWMASKGIAAETSDDSSGVETASYDPPYTLGPFRRNEVLIRLK